MDGSYSIRRIILLFGFHLLLEEVFIIFFTFYYHLGTWKFKAALMVFHLAVNGLLWLIVLSGSGLLLRLKIVTKNIFFRSLAIFLPVTLLNLLLLLWVVDSIVYSYCGNNATDQMIIGILRNANLYYQSLLSSKDILIIGLIVVSEFVGYYYFARPAIEDWGKLVQFFFRKIIRANWQTRMIDLGSMLGVLSIYLIIFIVIFWPPKGRRLSLWQIDPITSFVVLRLVDPQNSQVFFPPNDRRLANVQRDDLIRKNYPPQHGNNLNVILIIVDSLRADHLPMYGYERQTAPFLTSLQSEARLKKVSEVRSTCNLTYCGITSTLASRNYEDLGKGLFALQDLLKDQGYETYFILTGIHMFWFNIRQIYGKNIDYYFDGTMAKNYAADDDRLLFEGLEKVPVKQDRPAFFYFHLKSTHSTGIKSTEYMKWQPVRKSFLDRDDPITNGNFYDAGVLMADATINRLMTELDQKGYLKNSVVFITGDHGERLGEHDGYGHGKSLFDEELRIPLMIIDQPGIEYRNLASALQLDIAPTILDRIGYSIPETWQGKSLLRPDLHTYSFHYAVGAAKGKSVIYRDADKLWKYILSDSNKSEELYELRSDPHEVRNLINERNNQEILARLREKLIKESNDKVSSIGKQ